jgi:chromosome segregation ATPase
MPDQGSSAPALRTAAHPEFKYTLKLRFSDWYAGRTDGRHREPTIEADDPRTAYWRGLEDEKRRLAQNERQAYEEIVGDLRNALRQLQIDRSSIDADISTIQDRIAVIEGRLETAERKLAEVQAVTPASDKEQMARWRATAAQERNVHETEQALAAHQGNLAGAQERRKKADLGIADLEAQIEKQNGMFTAWLGECVEHFHVRINAYVKRLVRSHPQGQIIGQHCAQYLQRAAQAPDPGV